MAKKGNWYTRHFGFKPLPGTGTEPGVVESPKGPAQANIESLMANVPEADQRASVGAGKTDAGEGQKEKAISEKESTDKK